MKYIIVCGGSYDEWETPRQLEKDIAKIERRMP